MCETVVTTKVIYNNPFFSWVLHTVGKLFLAVTRWRVVGQFPKESKLVAIAAPHTSNWDFPVFMAAVGYLRLDVSFLGKHTLFQGPLGWLFYWLGGIPVLREGKAASEVVDQAVAAFNARDHLILGIAPEGTRSKVTKWKTGFHRIALEAGVPILPTYLNSETREIGFGDLFYPTDDLEADMAALQAFYADKKGIRTDNQ